jgi:hypothetical protein
MILYTLQGLGPEFETFVIVFSIPQGSATVMKLHSLLLAHEARIQTNLQVNTLAHTTTFSQQKSTIANSIVQALATHHHSRNNNSQGNAYFNRKNNYHGIRSGHTSSSTREEIQYQIYSKWGHSTYKCYHRFDITFTSPSQPQQTTSPGFSSQPQQALIAEPSIFSPSPAWFLDSDATTHVTPDLNNLSSSQPYHESDKVHMGDGTGLLISHTRIGSIPCNGGQLHLGNLLCVPHLTKNFLSISQLLKDNAVTIEFTSSSCLVKDLETQRILLLGSLCNGLYAIHSSPSEHQVHQVAHSSSNIYGMTCWHIVPPQY